MDLIQQGTKAGRTGTGTYPFGPALVIAAVIVTVVIAAILATSLIAGQAFGSRIASQENPLLQPAAVEFRQGERGAGVSPANPLLKPAAVEFRQGEHAAGGAR